MIWTKKSLFRTDHWYIYQLQLSHLELLPLISWKIFTVNSLVIAPKILSPPDYDSIDQTENIQLTNHWMRDQKLITIDCLHSLDDMFLEKHSTLNGQDRNWKACSRSISAYNNESPAIWLVANQRTAINARNSSHWITYWIKYQFLQNFWRARLISSAADVGKRLFSAAFAIKLICKRKWR